MRAEQTYRQILSQQPGHADAMQLLGVVMYQTGRNAEAIDLISRAIEIAPNISDWHSNLGGALRAAGKTTEAVVALRRAVELKPQSAAAHYNLGNALAELRQTQAAIDEFRQSLALRPDSAECWNNLGIALKDRDIAQAVECYRKAIAVKPDYDDAWSNLLLGLHYRADDPQQIFAEHVEWGRRRMAQVGNAIAPRPENRDANRRLRIGYVSADFREHSVAYFSASFLREHDHEQFEIFCYDNTKKPDQTSQTLQSFADHWRRIVNVPDEAVVQMIRDDRIDILVDLSGHSGVNRLPVFARKPAPIQVTYLGYPNTTGLPAMDYRLSDSVADPPGMTEAFNVERLVRMPQTAWCYTPSPQAPDVNELPALTSGYVTFASFNNLAKVTPQILGRWAEILLAVPHSRLLIKADGLHDEQTRKIILAPLVSAGVDPVRVELLPRAPSTAAHLATYHRCDVALDTFPYHGTTTTCEALWMGLPVIPLLGNMHVARVSASLLTTVGLSELIAESPEHYVKRAIDLANDLPRLAKLRVEMRRRLQSSPLLDSASFTRSLESAYRKMWMDLQTCG